ncbi:NAD(P)/FAD-dependent oxidoreductase [Schlegelella sp. S2-27]|uniref:NADH:ubiquinone reductase (non-electrogenic) n=1 Tax=Caldimonas mangrovi TaxID=2944811 RepID=A0ABT0YPQ1_9BURK|nr:NAD(P)/FAD-dependent oxidoreductase [Caldimonas mangrovi]MCM5680222.1 NAD(P)/FAD-dependent oxidoreductase [Caldimonas mangrovi]
MAAPLPQRPRVVIVGCGFGGLEATRALARTDVDITLIDRTNHHLFQPLLYQVATAGLAAPAISAPIRHILRRQMQRGQLTVLLGDVTGIDAQRREVQLDDGACIRYDHLIVAAGATHSYFGRDEWARHAPGLKTLADAFELRNRVLKAFERAERYPEQREHWLTFAVIGAGPTGVEMAGTMAEIAHHTLHDEFRHIDSRQARVVLIEGADRVLGAFPPDLSRRAQEQLEKLGVEVRTGCRVTHIDAQGVTAQMQGQDAPYVLPARTVVWAAGVAASPLGQALQASTGVALDRAGRVVVEPDLSLAGHPEIQVIGDLAAAKSHPKRGEPTPVPGVSPGAKQMGRHAAANLVRRLRGEATRPFRYIDYGSLATIGRKAAVAQVDVPLIGNLRFSGYFAWVFWLFVHIYFLIGFRNRLMVLMDWGWAYWTFQRHARVVVEPPRHRTEEAP